MELSDLLINCKKNKLYLSIVLFIKIYQLFFKISDIDEGLILLTLVPWNPH